MRILDWGNSILWLDESNYGSLFSEDSIENLNYEIILLLIWELFIQWNIIREIRFLLGIRKYILGEIVLSKYITSLLLASNINFCTFNKCN